MWIFFKYAFADRKMKKLPNRGGASRALTNLKVDPNNKKKYCISKV